MGTRKIKIKNSFSDIPKSESESRNHNNKIIPCRRIFFKLIRFVLLWVPLSLLCLTALILLITNVYLSPKRVERIAVSQFSSFSNGSLSLHVKKFSVYREILIENIIIKNPEEFGGNFAEIGRLRISYGFFSLLTGNIHFDEIGIYKPRIYLSQKKGIWNIEKLFKPSAAQSEKKEAASSSEIKLPISVNVLFNFILSDLKIKIRGDGIRSDIDSLTLKAKVIIPPFKTIPLSLKAVTLLKEMSVSLNPQNTVDFSFYSPDVDVEPPLILGWSLDFEKNNGKNSRFQSRFRFGTNKTPIRFKKAHLSPLDFMLEYDLYFDPVKDFLRLNSLSVVFHGKKWINLEGSVSTLTKKPDIDIKMMHSEISLTEISSYVRAVTGNNSLNFGGTMSLMPFSVRGTPDSLKIDGKMVFSSVTCKVPGFELAVPSSDFSYSIFSGGSGGSINTSLSVSRFVYTLDRSRSGISSLLFTCKLDAHDKFSVFIIDSGSFRFFNPQTGEDVFRTGIKGSFSSAGILKGAVTLQNIYFMKHALAEIVPDTLGKSLAGIPLKKEITGNISLSGSSGKVQEAAADAAIKIPDYGVSDFSLKADVSRDPVSKRVLVKTLSAEAPSQGFLLMLKGFIDYDKSALLDSKLSLNLDLAYPETSHLIKGIDFKGAIKIRSEMRGDLAKGKVSGSFDVKDFNMNIPQSKITIENMNLSFPFEYDFAYKPAEGSRITVDKSTLFESSLFKEKENFTVSLISAKHISRNESFAYLKDVRGTMFFKNNAFEIQKLSARVLDGTLLMKDTFFYLSNLDIHKMEYNFSFDLTNADVSILDQASKGKKDRSAELSMNARLYGSDLDFKRRMNVNGSVNIYKIGDLFANRLFKGLSTQKGKSKLGIFQTVFDNTTIPSSFNYYVNEGTMYTDVFFKEKAIGRILHVKDDRIRFERIPVQEYLQSIME